MLEERQRPSVVGPGQRPIAPQQQQPAGQQPAGLFDASSKATDDKGNLVDTETGEVTPKQEPAVQQQRPAAVQQPPAAAQQDRPVARQEPPPGAGVQQPKAPETPRASQLAQQTAQGLQLTSKTGSALNAFLTQYKGQIEGALPKHLTAERLIRITSTAVSRNPKLLDCDMGSMVAAVIQCGQLGLEPDTLGQAYLVPFFNNKTKRQEVQCIPGYKGLRTLAYRSGAVLHMHADIVYERDHWNYGYGTKHGLEHIPYTGAEDPGKKIAWYAYAHMVGGGMVFVVLRQKDIEKARAASKAQAFLWTSDPDSMEKKTAVRRLCDELPMSVDNVLSQATMLDLAASRGSSNFNSEGGGFQVRAAEEMMADASQFEAAEVIE